MITTNETIALFLNEKIYVSDQNSQAKKIASNEPIEQKKTVYIVEWNKDEPLDQIYTDLITKMNTAIKYQSDEMQILCFKKGANFKISEIKDVYGCDLLAIFGNFINSSNTQLVFTNNKILNINGIKVIQTNSIEEIYKETSIKNNYWNALKTILS